MGLRPSWCIMANGEDLAPLIGDRLVSLRVIDEAGIRSDSCTLTLANHRSDRRIALPPTGAELQVSIGYDGVLEPMGVFVVDKPKLKGPPDQVIISANAAPMTTSKGGQTPIQSQRSRSWPAGTTLGSFIRSIASEHGLVATAHAGLDEIVLDHLDQIDESDASLLTRLAWPYDVTVKVANGHLIAVRRGKGQLMPVTVPAADILTYEVEVSDRQASASVVAGYHDMAAGMSSEVTVGIGSPVRRLRHPYASEASARSAAEAELGRALRGKRSLTVSMIGNQYLQAEGRIVIPDHPIEEVTGSWLLSRVEHDIGSNGYRCSIRSEDYQPLS